jgi:predicted RNA-binding Zn-ribbon protein involved in translation (DUF1610 family)
LFVVLWDLLLSHQKHNVNNKKIQDTMADLVADANRATCPNCGSTQIEAHEAGGAMVCTECGVILEENAIVSAVEFVEGQGGASSM